MSSQSGIAVRTGTSWLSLIVVVMASPVHADVPDYGFQWSRITHAGNRAATESEASYCWPIRVGAVDHEYRLARTEVTVGQWFEFVQAYAPHYDGPLGSPGFTSVHIFPASSNPRGEYRMNPAAAEFPAVVSWHYAARFVNWLHNGKAAEPWAFESGAYDTSTFVLGPDGTFHDQLTRSPGATFWIPSRDEWVKGMHFDPDRYGDGEAGYWTYPNGSDTPLVPGLPQDGGQTSAGLPPLLDFPVGQYPDVQSPWGLLDGSGGWSEWLETPYAIGDGARLLAGSRTGEIQYEFFDRLDTWGSAGASGPSGSIRLASVIPSPGCGLFLSLALYMRRRSR